MTTVTDEESFGALMNRPGKNNFERRTIGAHQVNSSYHHRLPVLGELGAATSSDLLGISLSILIPLGSTEQHGPHLPLDTDTRIATAVCRAVETACEAQLHGAWSVAPAIAYGASGEHQSFRGTISIGNDALALLLGDPTTATAAEGRGIFTEMVDGCVRRIGRWSPGPDGMLT
ncbi:creatininase family protein [Mycobacterium tilburgii]|uniref:creatininase family protein n=1 Tax=Mycobacterium tilburgii TaxID=44467 RepID=UPI0011831AB0